MSESDRRNPKVVRVVPGPNGLQFIPEDQRAAPDNQKEHFAKNLRQLIEVLRLDRKEAAERIGVPYKWLWRMTTSGISRIDERNLDTLKHFAGYFLVPDIAWFREPGLMGRLLNSETGKAFTEKFWDGLNALCDEQSEKLAEVDTQRLTAMRKRLGRPVVVPYDNTRRFLEEAGLEGIIPLYKKWLKARSGGGDKSTGGQGKTGTYS